jgi:hypothetical protein
MLSRTTRGQRAHVGAFSWAGHCAGSPERHFSVGMATENSKDRLKRLLDTLDIY